MNRSKIFEVNPGLSVGKFVLGTPISDIIEMLVKENDEKNFSEILYEFEEPLDRDIMIKLNEGILLRFEPTTQRLKLIEVNRTRNVNLRCCDNFFVGDQVDSTFVSIYKLFGLTYPGKYDSKLAVYRLSYPGLCFVFPVPEKFRKFYEDHVDEVPIRFPDNTTPICSKVYVYSGRTIDEVKVIVPKEDSYFQEIFVELGQMLYFGKWKKKIKFHDSTQDILMKLGKPEAIFYKQNNKMRIHALKEKKSTNQQQVSAIDYFYNYFKLGLDIQFDGNTHEVKKFILHTNFPGSKDFNQYRKARFSIPISSFGSKKGDYLIHQDMKFTEIVRTLEGLKYSDPLVNRSDDTTTPFGGTRFYAYKQCIFEVLRNDHLQSVCFYKED